MTYLLLFYLLYFRFLKSEKHWQLMLCVVFFCLACLSRYTLVFHGILFVYVFVHGKMGGQSHTHEDHPVCCSAHAHFYQPGSTL